MARKIRQDESRAEALISVRNLVRFANCLFLPSLICSPIASRLFAFFFVACDDIGRVHPGTMKNNWMLSCKIAKEANIARLSAFRQKKTESSKSAATWWQSRKLFGTCCDMSSFFLRSNHFSARQNFSINRRLRYKRLRYWSAAAARRRKEEKKIRFCGRNFSSSRHHKLISREISIVELARRKSCLEKLLIESFCTELSTLLLVNEIVFLFPVCKLIKEMISK